MLSLLFALPLLVSAEQFVLYDVTFTYTKQDADTSTPSKSHYYVKGDRLNPNRPTDWTSPVDYRNGTVHIRAEILENRLATKRRPGPFATSPTKASATATAARARRSTRNPECMKPISP